VTTPIGPVPQVATSSCPRDRWGTIGARVGTIRTRYRVTPGLYAVGSPGSQSPVLVTANYKLTFDALRFQLDSIDAWILVIDTRGINIWCAAGKGTFSTGEVIFCVQHYQLAKVVSHRELILPQLAAPGVTAHEVKKGCGFQVIFGSVRSADLPAFFRHGKQCDERMREVTFTVAERLVLIPVEIFLAAKPLLMVVLLGFLLSGFGPTIFSLRAACDRGLIFFLASLLGIAGGAVLTPLLLPWLPFRQFWLKGIVAGILPALAAWLLFAARTTPLQMGALILWMITVSSYLAMNFTGSTPFTSLSGVDYEMRRALPVQIGATLLALILWIGSSFF
jgi:hypothetical protein